MWSFLKRKKAADPRVVSVSISNEGISLAIALFSPVLDSSSRLPLVVSHAEFIPCHDTAQIEYLLGKFVTKHNLHHAPCCFILHPKEYHLFLMDAPNVKEPELKQSAKWLVKDLIDFSVDDLVVDVFSAPVREGQKPKIFIVTAQKSYLEMMTHLFESVELQLKKIDIVELVIRDLVMMMEGADRGFIVLFSTFESLHIMILKGDEIYLVRRIDNFFSRLGREITETLKKNVNEAASLNTETEAKISVENNMEIAPPVFHFDDQKTIEKSSPDVQPHPSCLMVTKEIIKSIDYYQRQLGQEIPGKILLDWKLMQNRNFVNYLCGQTNIFAEEIPMDKMLTFSEGLSDMVRERCLAAIGGCFYLQEKQV